MYSLLLALIYLAFISLGLPDSLLGSAWPIMRADLGAPLSAAGVISMIIAGGTIVSSLFSDKLTKKLGAGLVTAASVALTAIALLGFSFSTEFWMLCVLAVPYGLGAGAVDAALNNYAALHYSSRQMNWLHAFWGLGVTISPAIMSYCLSNGLGWGMGYRTVSFIQMALTAILFISLPIWKGRACDGEEQSGEEAPTKSLSLIEAFKIKGAPLVLLAFFGYCALETTCGLWATSYLVGFRGIDAETAARFASLFYIGITAGRILNGFIADKLGDRRMIRIGIITLAAGVLLVALPVSMNVLALIGLIIIGLGAAPIYPSIIHSTPDNFGKENSGALVGIQMASAYLGSTFMPPVFGLIAEYISIGLYPLYLGIFAVMMFVMTELVNNKVNQK
ncbi:MAG: MFS transporter [Clostridia bacterium]|nr:MFS transporter [Clostridia bacterium]